MHANSYPHLNTRVGGGWEPSLEFLICCSISKRCCLKWETLIFSTRWGIFYKWWRYWGPVTSPITVAILATILDFTWSIKNQVKTPRNGIFFCARHIKWHINKHFASFYPRSFLLLLRKVERSWKNMHSHSKMAWPSAIYDVISRIHNNWPSLNLSQSACEW